MWQYKCLFTFFNYPLFYIVNIMEVFQSGLLKYDIIFH